MNLPRVARRWIPDHAHLHSLSGMTLKKLLSPQQKPHGHADHHRHGDIKQRHDHHPPRQFARLPNARGLIPIIRVHHTHPCASSSGSIAPSCVLKWQCPRGTETLGRRLFSVGVEPHAGALPARALRKRRKPVRSGAARARSTRLGKTGCRTRQLLRARRIKMVVAVRFPDRLIDCVNHYVTYFNLHKA